MFYDFLKQFDPYIIIGKILYTYLCYVNYAIYAMLIVLFFETTHLKTITLGILERNYRLITKGKQEDLIIVSQFKW